jgi:LuxR family maltose regulon positive regulatory protein
MALSGHTKLQRHDAAVQRHTQPRLCVSVNTIRTHMRHVYDKLGAHRRHEAVERARALGLLAPATRRP